MAIEGAHIAVDSGDEYVRYVSIDEDGAFNFILYGDYDYSIEARHFIDDIEGRSQRMRIPPGNSSGLKLVIQRLPRPSREKLFYTGVTGGRPEA